MTSNTDPGEKPTLFWLICLMSLAIIGQWLYQWMATRPLFLDEANLARNLFDRSFLEFFEPLDHRQYAPPLYMVTTKAVAAMGGYTENGLRLPGILAGIVTILALVRSGNKLKLGPFLLAPLGLLLFNIGALQYVTELKPYAFDLAASSLLLAVFLTWPKPSRSLALLGLLAPWFSLPSIFVLASIGITGVLRDYKHAADMQKWLFTGCGWLLSFGALYWLVLKPSIGEEVLTAFHSQHFFPVRDEAGRMDFGASLALLGSIPRVAFGHTIASVGAGTLLAAYAVFNCRYETALLLTLPLILVMVASSFGFYSLMPRLLLFTLPCWWLLAACGGYQLFLNWQGQGFLKWLPVLAILISMTGINYGHQFSVLKFSDSRRLTTGYSQDYLPVTNWSAEAGFDYYQRIHPQGKGLKALSLATTPLDSLTTLKSVVLFDVTTSQTVSEDLATLIQEMRGRGCKVRVEEMFRATTVYLDCKQE